MGSINDTQYQIMIYTGRKRGSSLKAGDVYVMLIGDKDTTNERRLPRDKQTFNRGSVDKFWVTGSNVGHLRQLHVRHTGKSGWFLEKIEVVNTNAQLTYTFPFRTLIKKGWQNPAASAVMEAEEVLDDKGNKIDVRSLPSLRTGSTPMSEVYNSVLVEPIEESDSSPAVEPIVRKIPSPWAAASPPTSPLQKQSAPNQPLPPPAPSPFIKSVQQQQLSGVQETTQNSQELEVLVEQQQQQQEEKERYEEEQASQQVHQQVLMQDDLHEISLSDKHSHKSSITKSPQGTLSASEELIVRQHSELVTQEISDEEKDEEEQKVDEKRISAKQNDGHAEEVVYAGAGEGEGEGDLAGMPLPIGEGLESDEFPLLQPSPRPQPSTTTTGTNTNTRSTISHDENLGLCDSAFLGQGQGLGVRERQRMRKREVLAEDSQSNITLQSMAKNTYVNSEGDVVIDFVNSPANKLVQIQSQPICSNFLEDEDREDSCLLSQTLVLNDKLNYIADSKQEHDMVLALTQSDPVNDEVRFENNPLFKKHQPNGVRRKDSISSASVFFDVEEGGSGSFNGESGRGSVGSFEIPDECVGAVVQERENCLQENIPQLLPPSSECAAPCLDNSHLWIEHPPDTKTLALIKYYPEVADLGNRYLIIVESAGVEKTDITYKIVTPFRVQVRLRRRVSQRLKNRYGVVELLNKHPHSIPDRVYRISVDLTDPVQMDSKAKVHFESGLWILEIPK